MPTQRHRVACKPRPPAMPAVNITTAELMVLMTIPGAPVVRLLGRKTIEAAVERLIDHLDALDAQYGARASRRRLRPVRPRR